MLCSHFLKRFPRRFSVGINLACLLWAIRHRSVIVCDEGCCAYDVELRVKFPVRWGRIRVLSPFAVQRDLRGALTGQGETDC